MELIPPNMVGIGMSLTDNTGDDSIVYTIQGTIQTHRMDELLQMMSAMSNQLLEMREAARAGRIQPLSPGC